MELDGSSGVELLSMACLVGLLVRLPVKTCALLALTSLQYDGDMAFLPPLPKSIDAIEMFRAALERGH